MKGNKGAAGMVKDDADTSNTGANKEVDKIEVVVSSLNGFKSRRRLAGKGTERRMAVLCDGGGVVRVSSALA